MSKKPKKPETRQHKIDRFWAKHGDTPSFKNMDAPLTPEQSAAIRLLYTEPICLSDDVVARAVATDAELSNKIPRWDNLRDAINGRFPSVTEPEK